jgi:microcystin-dependent protein
MININALCSFPSGTDAEWRMLTTPLPVNNIFYATDTNILKRGDGIHLWEELPTFLDIDAIDTTNEYLEKMIPLDGTHISKMLMTSEDGKSIIPTIISPEENIPTGITILWFTETPPNGFLELDGSWLSKTTYDKLYTILGDTYGSTDTQFKLPDTRGQFVRGWSHGTSTDPDQNSRTDRGDTTTGDHVGTTQTDEIKAHDHNTLCNTRTYERDTRTTLYGTWYSKRAGDLTVESTGGSETRPKNINVMFCIKY